MASTIANLLKASSQSVSDWASAPLVDIESVQPPAELPYEVFTSLLPASLSEVYGGEGVALLNDKDFLARKKLHQEFLKKFAALPPCGVVFDSIARVADAKNQNPAVKREAYQLLFNSLKNYRTRLIDRKYGSSSEEELKRISTIRDLHCSSDIFVLLSNLIVSSVTDLWSPVRKDSSRSLFFCLDLFNLRQIREIIRRLLAACSCSENNEGADHGSGDGEEAEQDQSADWRAIEGALLALAMIIKRFRRTAVAKKTMHVPSSSAELPHFESLRAISVHQEDEEDPHPSPRDEDTRPRRHLAQMQLRFCGKLYKSLPRFLLRPLRVFIEDMDLLGHPQLSVRENAIRLIATVVLRSPQHYAGLLFRYTLARLAGTDVSPSLSDCKSPSAPSTSSAPSAPSAPSTSSAPSAPGADGAGPPVPSVSSGVYGPPSPLPLPLPKDLEHAHADQAAPTGKDDTESLGSREGRVPSFDGSERRLSLTDLPPLPPPKVPFPTSPVFPADLLPRERLLPAFLSEGLLGLGVFLAATASNTAVKQLWPWAREVLTSYLGHQASTVRQACSKVFLQVASREDEADNGEDPEELASTFGTSLRTAIEEDEEEDELVDMIEDVSALLVDHDTGNGHDPVIVWNSKGQVHGTWSAAASHDGSEVHIKQTDSAGVERTIEVHGAHASLSNIECHGFRLMVSTVAGLAGLWLYGSAKGDAVEAALYQSMRKLLDAFTLGAGIHQKPTQPSPHTGISWEYKEGILLTYELIINMVVEQYRKGLRPFAEIHGATEWSGPPSLKDLGGEYGFEEAYQDESESKSPASDKISSTVSAFSSPSRARASPPSPAQPLGTPAKLHPVARSARAHSNVSPDAKPSPFPSGSPASPTTPTLPRRLDLHKVQDTTSRLQLRIASPNTTEASAPEAPQEAPHHSRRAAAIALVISQVLCHPTHARFQVYPDLAAGAGIHTHPPSSWHLSPDLTLLEAMQIQRALEAGDHLLQKEAGAGAGSGHSLVDAHDAFPFGECLWLMLLHIVECLGSPTFELRRMADQLLPLYTEFLVWFDPTIFEQVWSLSSDAVHRRDSRIALLSSRTLADVLSRYRVLSSTLQALSPQLNDTERFTPPPYLQFIPVPGPALPALLVAQTTHVLRRLLVSHTRAAEIITAGAPADGVLLLGCETLAALGKHFLRLLLPISSRSLIDSKYRLEHVLDADAKEDLTRSFRVRGVLAVLFDRIWRLSSLAYETPAYTVLLRTLNAGKAAGTRELRDALHFKDGGSTESPTSNGSASLPAPKFRFLGFHRLHEWLVASEYHPQRLSGGSDAWWSILLKTLEEIHAYVRASQKMYPHVDVIASARAEDQSSLLRTEPDSPDAPTSAGTGDGFRALEASGARLLDNGSWTPSPPPEEPLVSPHSPIPTSPHYSTAWRLRSPKGSPVANAAKHPRVHTGPGRSPRVGAHAAAKASHNEYNVSPSRRRRAAVLDQALAKALASVFPAVLRHCSFGETFFTYTIAVNWATTYEGEIRWLSLRAACTGLARLGFLASAPMHPFADAIALETTDVKASDGARTLPHPQELGRLLALASRDTLSLLRQCKEDNEFSCFRAVLAILGSCLTLGKDEKLCEELLAEFASLFKSDAPTAASSLSALAAAMPAVGKKYPRSPSIQPQTAAPPPPPLTARSRADTEGSVAMTQRFAASASTPASMAPPRPPGLDVEPRDTGPVTKLYTPNPYTWRGPALKDSISRLSVVAGAVCETEDASTRHSPRPRDIEGRERRLGSLSSVEDMDSTHSGAGAKGTAGGAAVAAATVGPGTTAAISSTAAPSSVPPPLKVPSINTALANSRRGAKGYIANMSPVGTPVMQTPSGLKRGLSAATASTESPGSTSGDSPAPFTHRPKSYSKSYSKGYVAATATATAAPPATATTAAAAPVIAATATLPHSATASSGLHAPASQPQLLRSQSMTSSSAAAVEAPPPFLSHLHLHAHTRLSDASLAYVGRRSGLESTVRVDTPPMSPPSAIGVPAVGSASSSDEEEEEDNTGHAGMPRETQKEGEETGSDDLAPPNLARSFTFASFPTDSPQRPGSGQAGFDTENAAAAAGLEAENAGAALEPQEEGGKRADEDNEGSTEGDEEDGLSEWDDWDDEEESEEEIEHPTSTVVTMAATFLASLRRSDSPAVSQMFQAALLRLEAPQILVIQWLLAKTN